MVGQTQVDNRQARSLPFSLRVFLFYLFCKSMVLDENMSTVARDMNWNLSALKLLYFVLLFFNFYRRSAGIKSSVYKKQFGTKLCSTWYQFL